jgi:HPt (histidine-containing phosphotransfer) domain-containing protein
MSLHQHRIDWMPSPPLVPDHVPIDFEHLGRTTFGDVGLEREVLGMFAAQAARLVAALERLPADAPALVHTLKGSARAIGAGRVADGAGSLEAALRDNADPAPALAELRDAVAEVGAAIEAILRRS